MEEGVGLGKGGGGVTERTSCLLSNCSKTTEYLLYPKQDVITLCVGEEEEEEMGWNATCPP